MIERGVAYVNLGCRVNRVELDDMVAQVEAMGCPIVGMEEAAAVLVNTCAVTGEAQAKTRKAIHRALSAARSPYVVATGCAATLFADELERLGDRVVVEPDKSAAPSVVAALLGASGAVGTEVEADVFSTPTGRMRPGIKIQDGCDLRCSYCIVWKARGRSRSVAPDDVVARVAEEVRKGAPEVVLTGINLGSYEMEGLRGGIGLARLLGRILDQTEVGRVRLSSTEPQDICPELVEAIASSGGRIAPYLHVPLQSGCSATLARMRRAYDADAYERAVGLAAERIDGLALGCDLIVGFPGETDEEFAESLALCERVGFAGMHVFRYSKRPGTPAATAPDQVEARVSAERARRARELASAMRREYAQGRVGADEIVCVQEVGKGSSGGLLDVIVDEDAAPGTLVRARIAAALPDATLDARGGLYNSR